MLTYKENIINILTVDTRIGKSHHSALMFNFLCCTNSITGPLDHSKKAEIVANINALETVKKWSEICKRYHYSLDGEDFLKYAQERNQAHWEYKKKQKDV